MGADATSTQLIFFIAATVVAVAASAALSSVIMDLSEKARTRGAAFGEQLASEIKVINDPGNVPASGSTIFYVKNIGDVLLEHTTVTTLLDGNVVTTTKSLLGGETTFRPGAVLQLTYASSTASGDHKVRVVMENGVWDELDFRVP